MAVHNIEVWTKSGLVIPPMRYRTTAAFNRPTRSPFRASRK